MNKILYENNIKLKEKVNELNEKFENNINLNERNKENFSQNNEKKPNLNKFLNKKDKNIKK